MGVSLAIGGVCVANSSFLRKLSSLLPKEAIFLASQGSFPCARVTPSMLVASKENMLRCIWHILRIFLLDSQEMKMKFTNLVIGLGYK